MTRDVLKRRFLDGPSSLVADTIEALDWDGWEQVVLVSQATRRGG